MVFLHDQWPDALFDFLKDGAWIQCRILSHAIGAFGPEVVYFASLNGSLQSQNPLEKVGCEALNRPLPIAKPIGKGGGFAGRSDRSLEGQPFRADWQVSLVELEFRQSDCGVSQKPKAA